MVEKTEHREGTTYLIEPAKGTMIVVLREWLAFDPELDELVEFAQGFPKDEVKSYVIDMENVDYIYSRHVGQLISLKGKARTKVNLCCVDRLIFETLHLLKMDEIFPLFDSRAEALASI